ncbi:MBL fold metallo-hydrolase [Clostridium sp. MCC353]|uniref:MBL fold metallo-hydrolase n=1 Tax=Clostridium sp. MCC353 TaxID=2592646 RepID=UPI001C021FC6|nr:MBL fold metallo-hydrolase [Clostridium sp. MCC353]
MKINEQVHQLKITFQLTPQIKRYVYVYIITGRHCYLIDTGVHGSETLIQSYLESIGKSLADVKGIFLTHSHPDHIGAAQAIKEASGAPVYACRGEREWMEDIHTQYKERPIPGFYDLLKRSIKIDHYIKENDLIPLESGLTLEVMETSGHSKESLSFYLREAQTLFTGDAIPVRGDIPIFVSHSKSLETLLKLMNLKQVSQFCPAWDHAYDREQGLQAMKDGYEYLEAIRQAAASVMKESPDAPEKDRFLMVCSRLSLDSLALNPLFFQSVHAAFEEAVISQPPQLPLPPSASCTDKGSPHTLL